VLRNVFYCHTNIKAYENKNKRFDTKCVLLLIFARLLLNYRHVNVLHGAKQAMLVRIKQNNCPRKYSSTNIFSTL